MLQQQRGPTDDTSPESLLAGARELAEALSLVAAQADSVSPRGAVLLAGHSTELALKAYLRKRGWSDAKLKNDLGHNLEAAWLAAVAAGLKIATMVPGWCKLVNTLHDRPLLGRYPPKNSGIVCPSPFDMNARVRALIEVVTTQP